MYNNKYNKYIMKYDTYFLEGGAKIKEIYLIRHGETEWNKKGLGQGSRNDIPLNELGIEQANYAGKYLNEYRQTDKKFDLVLCSPLIRTKETANEICKEIGYNIDDIIYFDELVENDQGLLSIGKTDEELRKDKFYNKFFDTVDELEKIKDPIEFNVKYEEIYEPLAKKYEFELYTKLRKRCDKIINYIKKSDKSKILIVSHGGTISNGFIPALFNIKKIKGDFINGSNCHLTYITCKNNKFHLIYGPSTSYYNLYNKNYGKMKTL